MSQIYYRARTIHGNVVVCHNTEQDKYYLAGNPIPFDKNAFEWIDTLPIGFDNRYHLNVFRASLGLKETVGIGSYSSMLNASKGYSGREWHIAEIVKDSE